MVTSVTRASQQASRQRLTVSLKNRLHDSFVLLSRGPLDLAPWLYVTPAELAPFRDLLLRLGAREAFSAVQYAAVLAAMAKRAGGQPLDAITLAQAISIVQVCAHSMRQ